MNTRWDDPTLQNKPGQWKPTEQPYRVHTYVKHGPRYDAFRTIVRTFATEDEARQYMATIPRKYRPKLSVAMNAETWNRGGYWKQLPAADSMGSVDDAKAYAHEMDLARSKATLSSSKGDLNRG